MYGVNIYINHPLINVRVQIKVVNPLFNGTFVDAGKDY
jgi:hypothetical protein